MKALKIEFFHAMLSELVSAANEAIVLHIRIKINAIGTNNSFSSVAYEWLWRERYPDDFSTCDVDTKQ